jgi:enoyl-CoA hydratase/carnithine racemase
LPATLAGVTSVGTAAEKCRKPVVAAIDGYTMGAGLGLAVACDFRIVTMRSEFACPAVRPGMIPGSGRTQRAEAWGLITQAVPDGGLDEAVARSPASWPSARRWRCAR